VEAGLLARDDWSAAFITSALRIGPKAPLQPIRFQKDFILPGTSVSFTGSRLYITALGIFEAYVNGQRTSNECMAPGWTSYRHRLSYRVHDVSSLLKAGTNTICVEVGEGWYAGQLGIQSGGRFLYGGEEVALLAQLEVHSDVTRDTAIITSDETWQATPSATVSSEIYNGETYDQRQGQGLGQIVCPLKTNLSSHADV
jgi:alpha-L-rhamnosidase